MFWLAPFESTLEFYHHKFSCTREGRKLNHNLLFIPFLVCCTVRPVPSPLLQLQPLLLASFKRITNNYNIFLRIYRNMCASSSGEGVSSRLIIMFLLVFLTSPHPSRCRVTPFRRCSKHCSSLPTISKDKITNKHSSTRRRKINRTNYKTRDHLGSSSTVGGEGETLEQVK